jgi:hypothetical protein
MPCHDDLEDAMQVAGAVAVDGRSGTGRTFATQLVCTRIGMPTVTLRRCRIVRRANPCLCLNLEVPTPPVPAPLGRSGSGHHGAGPTSGVAVKSPAGP